MSRLMKWMFLSAFTAILVFMNCSTVSIQAEEVDKVEREQESLVNNQSQEATTSTGTWIKNHIGWWYEHLDGSYTTNDFEEIDGHTYYFDVHGYTSKGWKQINGNWYYLQSSGAVAKNTWINDRYVDENGIWTPKYVVEGWIKNSIGWWYCHADGSYTTNNFEDIGGYTYYFDSRGYTTSGWKQINGNWYYLYGSGAVAKNTWINDRYVDENGIWIPKYVEGWVKNSIGWWYRHADGSYTSNNFEDIGGYTYYFDSRGYTTSGWKQINGNWYYLYSSGAVAKNTWIGDRYVDEKGIRTSLYKEGWIKNNTGWWYRHTDGTYTTNNFEDIGGYTYYFDSRGYTTSGWKQINGNRYYLYSSGAVAKDTWIGDEYVNENGIFTKYKEIWIKNNVGWWYRHSDGSFTTNGFEVINNHTYYFNSKGYMVSGLQSIGGSKYLFSNSGNMLYDWQKINGSWYFFDIDGKMHIGWLQLGQQRYYYTGSNGIMKTGWQFINGHRYYFNSIGLWVEYYYDIPYYSQLDARWRYKYYGNYTMGSTGCVPTSLSMAISYFKGKQVLPVTVADYLYKESNTFNRIGSGASGEAVGFLARAWGLNFKNNLTKDQIIEELKAGKLVIMLENPGQFSVPGATHCIVLHGIDVDNNVYVYDPYWSSNNRYFPLDLVYNQQSTHPYDLMGGGPCFSVGR